MRQKRNHFTAHIKGILLFAGLLGLNETARAQGVKRFDPKPIRQYVSVFFDLNQNMTAVGGPAANKSVYAPFGRVGVQYRYQFTPRFFAGGGVMSGNGNFRYRYYKTFAPTSDTTYAKGEYGRGGRSVMVFEPYFEIGRIFPLSGKHRLDVSAGISFPLYHPSIFEVSDTTYSSTVLSTRERMRYGTVEEIQMNDNGMHYGVGNVNLYIGYKRINYNALTEKLGIGLIFSYSFFTSNAALSKTRSYNVSYNYQMGEDVIQKFTYASFGVRFTYDLL